MTQSEKAILGFEKWCDTELLSLVEEQFKANYLLLLNNYTDCLEHLLSRYKAMQVSGKKGPLKYIAISHLHTGLHLRKNTHRIEMMDENYLEDWHECAEYWDLSACYRPLFDKAVELERDYGSYGSFKGYMVDNCVSAHGQSIHQAFREWVIPLVSAHANLEEYRTLYRSHSLCVVYGEYRDAMKIIYREGDLQEDGVFSDSAG